MEYIVQDKRDYGDEIEKVKHTSSNDVVDDDHLLTGLDRIGLHLEVVRAILLLVTLGVARTGELALLANGDKASTHAQGQARSHQEATGLQANDDIGLLVAVALEDVELQAAEQGFVQHGISEDREDIFEQDTGGREVGELAQGLAQLYFKTGEFGGAGGRGGGLSGDLGGGGGIGRLHGGSGSWLRHGERRRKRKRRRGGNKKVEERKRGVGGEKYEEGSKSRPGGEG